MDASEFHDLFFGNGCDYPTNDTSQFNNEEGAQDASTWDFDFQQLLGDDHTGEQNEIPVVTPTLQHNSQLLNSSVDEIEKNYLKSKAHKESELSLQFTQELPKFNTFSKYQESGRFYKNDTPLSLTSPNILSLSAGFTSKPDLGSFSTKHGNNFQSQPITQHFSKKSSPYQQPNSSPYQPLAALPESPYTKQLESPYGSVKSDSSYKAIESPYSTGKQIESSFGATKPVGSPYSLNNFQSQPITQQYSKKSSPYQQPTSSPYQPISALPESPYTKQLESPYGSVKSDSSYKAIESPYSAGKQVEPSFGVTKPVGSPYSLNKPLESPYSMNKSVGSPYGLAKPVESPCNIGVPSNNAYTLTQESPYNPVKPVGSPYCGQKSSPYGFDLMHKLDTVYQCGKPAETAFPKTVEGSFSKSVESPFSKSVESPFSKSVESPFSRPIESPFSRSIESPFSRPIESPFSKPAESPYSFPRSAESQAVLSQSVDSPYSMPQSAENPILCGKLIGSPHRLSRSNELPNISNHPLDTSFSLQSSLSYNMLPSEGTDKSIDLLTKNVELSNFQCETNMGLLDFSSATPGSSVYISSSPSRIPNNPKTPLEILENNLSDNFGASEADPVVDDITHLINKQVENFTAETLNDSFCSTTPDECNKTDECNKSVECDMIIHESLSSLHATSPGKTITEGKTNVEPEDAIPSPSEPEDLSKTRCSVDEKLEELFRNEEKVTTCLDPIDEVERKLEALHNSSKLPVKTKPTTNCIMDVFQTPPSTSSSPCDLLSVPCDRSKLVQNENKTDQSSSAMLSPSSNEGDVNQRVKTCSCILCQEHFSRRKHRKKRKRENSLHFKSEVCSDKVGIKLKISRSTASESFIPPIPDPQVILNETNSKHQPNLKTEPKSRPHPDYSLMKPDFLKKPLVKEKQKRVSRKKRAKKRKPDSSESEFEDWSLKDLQGSGKHVPCNVPSEASEKVRLSQQSPWATQLPPGILERIFNEVTEIEGCLPSLVRLSKVCRSWKHVASSPELWHTIDLSSNWVKERHRTERKLVWLLQHRLTGATDLNLGGWNSAFRPGIVQLIASNCSKLEGLNLNGCSAITQDHMIYLAQALKSLKRLDLSNVSDITQSGKSSPVSQSAITDITKILGSRLTHLNLAANSTSGLSNVINAIAASCNNLQVLDLSNVKNYNKDIALINIEKLQGGCKKLRVLRLTNIQMRLASSSSKDQALSQGFPELEELSVAVSSKHDSGIDDLALERIVKASSKLRLLDVRGCVSISYSSLVRITAWDLEQLFLSGCKATRFGGDGLELVIRKWGHSLEVLDLSWSTAPEALDIALATLAEQENSPIKSLDLSGSAVGYAAVKTVLEKCIRLGNLNLSSCRGLPRGMKRNYSNSVEVAELRSAIEAGRFDEKPDTDNES
ncbi:uncharacterized protein LOC136041352 [Artemia franciscana]|nr:hypothetical protein QYM36_017693 [Artemia franciscana]KAK2703976.1 hypothetical protein QYM36_017693 [Artemia franciscana]